MTLKKPDERSNFCAVYGSLPHKNVKATSTLAVELLQRFVQSMLNMKQEITLPDDILSFKGVNGKFNIANETEPYALRFGEKTK